MPPASSRWRESGWQFGALAKSSPVQFAIPNRSGETVQITRAGGQRERCGMRAELSTVTRWQIGGAPAAAATQTFRPQPFFGMGAGTGAAGRRS